MSFNISVGTISAQQAYDANRASRAERAASANQEADKAQSDPRPQDSAVVEAAQDRAGQRFEQLLPGAKAAERAEAFSAAVEGSYAEMAKRLARAEAALIARDSGDSDRAESENEAKQQLDEFERIASGTSFEKSPAFDGQARIVFGDESLDLPKLERPDADADRVHAERVKVEAARAKLEQFNERTIEPAVRRIAVAAANIDASNPAAREMEDAEARLRFPVPQAGEARDAKSRSDSALSNARVSRDQVIAEPAASASGLGMRDPGRVLDLLAGG